MTAKTQTVSGQQVTLHVDFRAKAGKEKELKSILLSLLEPTRREPGCINYDLHEDPNDPANFMFYENWSSMEALEAHKAMPYIANFFQISGNLLEKPAVLSIWQIIA